MLADSTRSDPASAARYARGQSACGASMRFSPPPRLVVERRRANSSRTCFIRLRSGCCHGESAYHASDGRNIHLISEVRNSSSASRAGLAISAQQQGNEPLWSCVTAPRKRLPAHNIEDYIMPLADQASQPSIKLSTAISLSVPQLALLSHAARRYF